MFSKKKEKIEWNNYCEESFQKLREICSSTPILAYADYSKPYRLYTNACGLGLGAVLYQKQADGTDQVIVYASRTLSKSERNYPAHKPEFSALKWAITDNNPFTYIMTSAKLNTVGQCWVVSLANYNLQLFYKIGKSHVEADTLSCIP